ISSDLLNNPETGLLNLKGKNAIGKGHEYTQQFDAQVEQLAMSLPEQKHHQYLAEKTSANLLTELHDSQPDVRILLVRLAL
ncbi:hypothetical protein, partial [Klebsiella pneumoniae]|uniref:hypothetical protein n=1 Tax=Klebsiella pneumoniae TaxID=573 RepID=UPI001F1CFC4D